MAAPRTWDSVRMGDGRSPRHHAGGSARRRPDSQSMLIIGIMSNGKSNAARSASSGRICGNAEVADDRMKLPRAEGAEAVRHLRCTIIPQESARLSAPRSSHRRPGPVPHQQRRYWLPSGYVVESSQAAAARPAAPRLTTGGRRMPGASAAACRRVIFLRRIWRSPAMPTAAIFGPGIAQQVRLDQARDHDHGRRLTSSAVSASEFEKPPRRCAGRASERMDGRDTMARGGPGQWNKIWLRHVHHPRNCHDEVPSGDDQRGARRQSNTKLSCDQTRNISPSCNIDYADGENEVGPLSVAARPHLPVITVEVSWRCADSSVRRNRPGRDDEVEFDASRIGVDKSTDLGAAKFGAVTDKANNVSVLQPSGGTAFAIRRRTASQHHCYR